MTSPMFFPGVAQLVKLWTWRLNWRALIVVAAAFLGYAVTTAARDLLLVYPLTLRALERVANRFGRVLDRTFRRAARERAREAHASTTPTPEVLDPDPDRKPPGVYAGAWKLSSMSPIDEAVLKAALEPERKGGG